MAAIDSCGPNEIRNFFTRAQFNLEPEFSRLSPKMGIWNGKIKNLGTFEGKGYAARVTTLGFERLRYSTINFRPMVGLQEDCAASCDTPATQLNLGNADHRWYRMTELAMNTEVFCLEKMSSDALNLTEQLTHKIDNMRGITEQIMDEFKRSNFVAIAKNKWLGVDGQSRPRRGLWRFAEDANGDPNVNKIIIDASVDAVDIALPSIGLLNTIIDSGTYNRSFPEDGGAELITDLETSAELPKWDTNTRMDNRYRAPGKLDPAYNAINEYANIRFTKDPFNLRYYWDVDDPDYPDGVLTRIEPWTDEQVSEGCWDDVSQDYLDADFQLSPFYNDEVYGMQGFAQNGSLPGGTYPQPQSPYNGMWKFINGHNEITPCNLDLNKAFWRMIYRKAAKPLFNGVRGNVVLHRRFGGAGLVKSCRALTVPVGGSYDCSDDCAQFDWSPPALTTRVVCGSWDSEGITGCSAP